MKIRTGLSAGYEPWLAVDDDTYDIGNEHEVGYGATEHEAIADLMRLKQEREEESTPPQNACPYSEAEIERSQAHIAAILRHQGVAPLNASDDQANARLIAAAPEMLAVLQNAICDETAAKVERIVNTRYGGDCTVLQAMAIAFEIAGAPAAIAKATGE